MFEEFRVFKETQVERRRRRKKYVIVGIPRNYEAFVVTNHAQFAVNINADKRTYFIEAGDRAPRLGGVGDPETAQRNRMTIIDISGVTRAKRTSAATSKPIGSPTASRRTTEPVAQRPPFERIALILSGGGALGSYQAGVYQALAERNLHPDWVAGISIGAVNAALIAGNPPERRVERLREFWETVSGPPPGVGHFPAFKIHDNFRRIVNHGRSLEALLGGAPGFFKLRVPPPYLNRHCSLESLSYYDVAPLKSTLERLVDFDLINVGATRFSAYAVNVGTGNVARFDSATCQICPEHVMASGSLPPALPTIKIGGEYYWDGGLVSNTPLQWVLDTAPKKDTLAFHVDLWSPGGGLPRDFVESEAREKDILFSSQTRTATDQFKKAQCLRRATAQLLAKMPEELRQTPEAETLAAEADEKLYNLVQLSYRKNYAGNFKDYEFSRSSMEEHWRSGYNDAVRTLRQPAVLQRPNGGDGVVTFDLTADNESMQSGGVHYGSNATPSSPLVGRKPG
jgi:NTE family protein